MTVLAHIGGIPVQESLPFLVPIVALVIYGRRRGRRRRREVSRLPDAAELLDGPSVQRVLAEWSKGRHADAAARHVPLFYPPGPDGLTAGELAARTGESTATVARLLAELQELGYIDLEGPDQDVSLTLEGYDLLDATESALLEVARERAQRLEAAPRAM
jgi:DNA-binding transcriptional ArsR family regulator